MDGIYQLRKRPVTRLWYRQMPAKDSWESLLESSIAWDESDPFDALLREEFAATESERVAMPAQTVEPAAQIQAEEAPADPPTSVAAEAASKDDTLAEWGEWRAVPAEAPSLLLSGSPMLDARVPGPILRPGCHYRVTSLQNGVVGLSVTDPDGVTSQGYCASIDLGCIDSRFAERSVARAAAGSLRMKVQRLSWSLSQSTASLLS